MPRDKAKSLDGLRIAFHQNYWDIVVEDLFSIKKEFQRDGQMLWAIHKKFIVMVQKDKGGGFISGRISLCSSSYKIMDKVLSLRMEIIPFIIASAQGGFVKGHQIHDGILLAHERSSMLSLKVVLQESFSSVTCGRSYIWLTGVFWTNN